MNIRNIRTIGRLVLLLPLILPKPTLHAQEGARRGNIEIGVRALAGDRSSSQFNEYRDLTPGLYVQQAGLDLESLFQTNCFLSFQTRQSWQKDQRFLGTFGNYGKFVCDVRWDGTPHDFTNTAATLYTESSPGAFVIPAATRAALQANAAVLPQVLTGATALNVAMRRKLGSGTCQATPSAAWSFYTKYSRESASGYRPFGTTTNDMTNVLEQMEPTEYRTQQVNAGLEYATQKGGFQAGYAASIFDNP